jgi:hypothetical protein
MQREGHLMVSITGLNIVPLANLPKAQASDAIKAALQSLSAANASNAADSPASEAVAGNNSATGFKAVPRLSADVVSALISNQSQESTGGASSTNLDGVPAAPASDSSQAATTSAAPSGPPTLQQIAGEFDLHHLTHQQEEELNGKLVSSGALSQREGFALFARTVLADAFNGQHYRIVNGQPVAATPSPPGTIVGNDPPGGPQYDIVQRVQQSLAADQYFGDTENPAKDQTILNVLNKLDAIRNGSTA